MEKKLFFKLLYLKIQNNQILKSRDSKFSHRDFGLVRNIAGPQPSPLQTVGIPSALMTRLGCLEESSHQHWPTTTETRMDCVVCHGHTKKMLNSKCQNHSTGCVYQDVSNTITQGTVLDSKLQQWVIQEHYKAQGISTDKVCNNLCIK